MFIGRTAAGLQVRDASSCGRGRKEYGRRLKTRYGHTQLRRCKKVFARIPHQRGKCKAWLPCCVARFTSSWLKARSVWGGRDETVLRGRSDMCAHATWLCSRTCCLLVWTCCPVRRVCACCGAVAATRSVRALPCGLGPPAYGLGPQTTVVSRHARHTRVHVCSGPPFVRYV